MHAPKACLLKLEGGPGSCPGESQDPRAEPPRSRRIVTRVSFGVLLARLATLQAPPLPLHFQSAPALFSSLACISRRCFLRFVKMKSSQKLLLVFLFGCVVGLASTGVEAASAPGEGPSDAPVEAGEVAGPFQVSQVTLRGGSFIRALFGVASHTYQFSLALHEFLLCVVE